MHQILIDIDKEGKARVKAEGFQGPSCTLVTAPFIAALGAKTKDQPTEEMFQQATQQVTQ